MWLLPAVPLKPPVLAGMGGCFPAPAVLLALFSIFPFSRLPDGVVFLRRQSGLSRWAAQPQSTRREGEAGGGGETTPAPVGSQFLGITCQKRAVIGIVPRPVPQT